MQAETEPDLYHSIAGIYPHSSETKEHALWHHLQTSRQIHPQPKISCRAVQVNRTAWIWIMRMGADVLSRL
jgi:hypothetical protein